VPAGSHGGGVHRGGHGQRGAGGFQVGTGSGVRAGAGGAAGAVTAGAGADTGAGDGTGVVGPGPGPGVGAAAGAVRDGASGDDGNGTGRGFPDGSLAAAAAERRTEHSTRPQKAVSVGGCPPDSCMTMIAAEPPSRTSPAAAHAAGYRRYAMGRESLRLLNVGSPPGGGSAESPDDPSGMRSPLLTCPELLNLVLR
jgi:hypothetical protein